jgi:hypothetical protein
MREGKRRPDADDRDEGERCRQGDPCGGHIAGELVVLANLTPVFLSPYSPELNPIERLWLYLKDSRLTHRVFDGTAEIIDACCDPWIGLLAETGRIRSLCSYPRLENVSA